MSNFYCAAPWRGLHINSRGDVKTCCAGNPNMLGNLHTNDIEQILNGPKMAEIRHSISQGQPHAYCYNCVNAERFGNHSERDWHNNKNSNIDYATAGERYHYPSIVDVRWNNTCNLSCNYCGPMDSSRWASLKNITVDTRTRHYYEDVCDFIAQHHANIQEVALVGGEPLLLKENIKLLDVIPDHCVVTIITNLSNPLQDNEIFKKLAKRQRVGWSISFDNIGQQFEYVRHGGNWQLLLDNLSLIKSFMVKTSNQDQAHLAHWGGIHAVYNMYNVTRITELRQFAHDHGFTVLWQNLFTPACLDPTRHGPKVAELAVQEIDRFYSTGLATNDEKIFFDSLKQTYQTNQLETPELEQEFQQHIHNMENKYHPDQLGQFSRLWPELEFLCK
jgi:sulfatase maturation enzyme AslB (radical SAM superfamily)